MRKTLATILTFLSILLLPGFAAAHVIVTPQQVTVGSRQLFSISVPNERNVPVTAMKLLIPDGLQDVMPTAKSGWTISVQKSADKLTEIDWSDGSIPVGLRDDFSFSAQVPVKAATLQWKAYQTYQDGTVISWDQPATSGGDDDSGTTGPYSTTKVVDDLGSQSPSTTAKPSSQTGAYVLSGTALLLALVALTVKRR